MKLRIRAEVDGNIKSWFLEKRKWSGLIRVWRRVFKHEDIKVIEGVKDHLLQPIRKFSSKSNLIVKK